MIPLLAPIVSLLASKGLDLLSSAIDGGADKAKEYIEEKTGIKLDASKGLSPEQVVKLREFESTNKIELEKLALENKKEDNRHAEKYEELAISDKQNARGSDHLAPLQTDIAKEVFDQTKWQIPLLLAMNVLLVAAAKQFALDEVVIVAVGNLLGIALNNAYRERQSLLEFLFGSSVGSKIKDK